ncbi:unnamed protein product [Fusarium venenatum]|uniref:Retrotransposon gag domain-containing protein n=1 Tax=Fusarium venenatum TaxID=56646 RepID=A0A2L2TQP8_9HYPO|nr:uncharacterized protein FVRRES_11050 [Fusarium venenatum]CEI70973.1 unnamed protein product [Fusarium venenatum]
MPMNTDDDEEGEIVAPPMHPKSHKDEVKKLRRRLKHLREQHDELLNSARRNATISQGKIERLEEQVGNLTSIAKGLGEEAEKTQRLYKEHIEHTATLVATGKDPGEILRPRQPDSYDGNAEHLQGFLTALRSYQLYYPVQFSTDEMKTRHAMSLLKGKAQRLMEPIVRDYVNNPRHERKDMTRLVYDKYENFEQELIHAFGLANERREAESKIRNLRQTGSAAAYLSEYRYQAAKLDWNESAHMDQVYLGLKEEVKDALVNIRPKPKTLNDLANIVSTTQSTTQSTSSLSTSAKAGITVGSVIGGLGAIGLVARLVLRRKNRKSSQRLTDSDAGKPNEETRYELHDERTHEMHAQNLVELPADYGRVDDRAAAGYDRAYRTFNSGSGLRN